MSTATTQPTIFITPLSEPASFGQRDHCDDIDNALLYQIIQCETAALANEEHRTGAFAFENATSQAAFERFCVSIGRPELVRQSRIFPVVGGVNAAHLKVLQESFNLGQARVNQVWDAVKATWTPNQRVTFSQMRFPNMAAYRQYIDDTYGSLDDQSLEILRAKIATAFSPDGDIDADLNNIQRNINRLPVDKQVVYNDEAKIAIAMAALRPEEAAQIRVQLDGLFPRISTRTWAQFLPIASAQVKNYRFQHPFSATAAAGAGKKGGHVADAPLYCFAHGSKSHNGDACKDLEKLIADSPAYKFVSKLKANRAKDTITVKLPAQELKLKAGFLRFKGKEKNPAPAAPRPTNNPRQRAPAAAASVATDADTDIQDDLSTLGGSGWGTADGSDA